MHKIYKYTLTHGGQSKIMMPAGALFIALKFRQSQLCFWALVDPNAEKTERIFRTYQTGEEIINTPVSKKQYLGSCITSKLTVHLFEITQ